MMRKTASIIMLFALLILLVAGIQVVEVAEANFVPQASIGAIWSPTNTTYSFNSLILNVTVGFVSTENRWIAYSLDGNENVTVTGIEYQIDGLWKGIKIIVPLPTLSEGSHRLDVYAQSIPTSYASPDSKTVFFTIDTITPTPSPTPSPFPSPTINSTANITPTITPSQNPQPSPTITNSSPSPSISPSTSPTQQPTLEPSPTPENTQVNFTSIIIILGSLAVAVALGVLVYFKKIKK